MTDFRNLLKLVVIESEADDILATRISDDPNAPTIGDLLRWGENVAKAKPCSMDADCVAIGPYHTTHAGTLFVTLITEGNR